MIGRDVNILTSFDREGFIIILEIGKIGLISGGPRGVRIVWLTKIWALVPRDIRIVRSGIFLVPPICLLTPIRIWRLGLTHFEVVITSKYSYKCAHN